MFQFRHSVRPFFQGTLAKKRLYNILGCIAFQLTISYTFIGLETLEFAKTFTIYRYNIDEKNGEFEFFAEFIEDYYILL